MNTDISARSLRLRLVLVLLGGGAFALGVLIAFTPGSVGKNTLAPLVTLLGNDFMLVAVFGVVSLLVVAFALLARGVSGLDQAAPPDPEDVHQVPLFGEPLDDVVVDADLKTWLNTDRHEEIRDRLRDAAITTVMRDANCTRTEAEARVKAGTWTDNEVAATFLTESGTPALSARIAAAIRGDSPFQQAARTAADEIVARDPEVDSP